MHFCCTSNFLRMYLNQADDVLQRSYYLVCFFSFLLKFLSPLCVCVSSVLALLSWSWSFRVTECLPGQIISTPSWPCSPSISCCFFSFAPFSKWSNHKWNEACRIKINKFGAAHWLNNCRCVGSCKCVPPFSVLWHAAHSPKNSGKCGTFNKGICWLRESFVFFSLVNLMETHKVFSNLDYILKVPVVVEWTRLHFRFALQFGGQ